MFLVVGLAAACSGGPASPRVRIDVPTTGARIEPGQEVKVLSHAYAPQGVAEALLTVNGDPYRRDPAQAPGQAFSRVSQVWVSDQPGEYALQVIAYDVAGSASPPAVVWVTVLSPVTPAASTVSSPTATATQVPTPTTATPTFTPSPPVTAEFWADRTSLTAGECTTLHWKTEYATTVLLGTTSVASQGAMQFCPETSTSYRLTASGTTGEVERTVSLMVTAPQDTQGPALSGLSNTPASIWDGSGCGPTTATITLTATDASGITQVELHYRVVKGSQQGQWRVVSMSSAGGDLYSTVLGVAELASSMTLYGGGTVEYWAKATDGRGNSAQTATATFAAQLCLG